MTQEITAGVSASTPAAQEQRDENAAYLPELTRECELLGFALDLTDDRNVDLAELKTINGVRTILARADDLAVALDDVRGFRETAGRCIDCKTPVDDTMTPYHPGYDHLDGTPCMICQQCRDERTRLANEPDRLAFSRCLDAIEAVFEASKDTEMTRNALRTFVDMTADEAREKAGARS